MRYRKPPIGALADYLDDNEADLMLARGATDREMNQRARSNAWKAHREHGPAGRIGWLCECAPGASELLRGYTSTKQTSAIVASVADREGRIEGREPRFSQRIERHDLSDEILGVRVTFLGFSSQEPE